MTTAGELRERIKLSALTLVLDGAGGERGPRRTCCEHPKFSASFFALKDRRESFFPFIGVRHPIEYSVSPF
jgi:hypothetical protein